MIYRILSALLSYPQQELLDALPEIEAALADDPQAAAQLEPLLAKLRSQSLIALQEDYVATFDRSLMRSLHLFEHVHGESRDRGQAMVDLLHTYQQHGFEPAARELPDYVPLFLEFLSLLPAPQAQGLLDDAIHVLAAIGMRLSEADSAYAVVFAQLRRLASVAPDELPQPPARDMDEAMAALGPGQDGVEPLLQPMPGASVRPLRFYPDGMPKQA